MQENEDGRGSDSESDRNLPTDGLVRVGKQSQHNSGQSVYVSTLSMHGAELPKQEDSVDHSR